MNNSHVIRIAVIVCIAAAVIYGYESFTQKQAAMQTAAQEELAAQQAAPTVSLYTVKRTDASETKDFVGRAEAIQSVKVTPQVAGEIEKVSFSDGAVVHIGENLFVIDKSQYQASVNLKKAEVAQAKATLEQSVKYLKRLRAADKRSVSASDIDTATSAVQTGRAALEQAQASLKLAQIDLNHTNINAPINGKIGKAEFTKGNYVQKETDSLATIVQMDPIRVTFSLPDRDYLDMFKEFKKNSAVFNTLLTLSNGQKITAQGKRDYENNEMDPKTGTMQITLRFANKSGLLVPRSMVRVGIKPIRHSYSNVIPQEAIMADSQGDYVYVVDGGSVAHQRRIKLGDELGSMRKVVSGLKTGEKIVVSGLQSVRPEAHVAPAGK